MEMWIKQFPAVHVDGSYINCRTDWKKIVSQ